MRTHFFDTATCAAETEEQPSTSPTCGARTRSGAPCDRDPEPGRRRCRRHGGAPGTGAPRGNTNAHRHGRYSAKSREIRALGRLLNRVADLAKAQMAVMDGRAHDDAHCVEVAEQQVSRCVHLLAKAAVALDRVLAARGDEEGRRLVEGALRLTADVPLFFEQRRWRHLADEPDEESITYIRSVVEKIRAIIQGGGNA